MAMGPGLLLRGFVVFLLCVLAPRAAVQDRPAAEARPNLLLITADDLNRDSVGCYGCKLKSITPNIDRLAAEGMRFLRAHVTIAVCQPCRSVLMTGRYPHRNGAVGFGPIDAGVPTLVERLRLAGYLTGILGKTRHLRPKGSFPWDDPVMAAELGQGRDPGRYRAAASAFFARAKKQGRPFFLMANAHDPHRPFAGSASERRRARRRGTSIAHVDRTFDPDEVPVPGFLPDLPAVREELAQYFASVHRCDQTVGAILAALDDAGLEKSTLVLFLSDHGMAFPFAKTNCYLQSTNVPWIVRWPGVVRPGSIEAESFVSGIDFMPSMLEAAGLERPDGMDGRSFLPLLKGEEQAGRGQVVTVFFETSAKRRYPMRCVQDRRFGYIFNAWSNGRTVFRNESQAGLTFKAMRAAARDDEKIAARVELFLHRVPEELYDFANDPDARHNLVHDKEHAATLAALRRRLLAYMKETDDPLRARFERWLGR